MMPTSQAQKLRSSAVNNNKLEEVEVPIETVPRYDFYTGYTPPASKDGADANAGYFVGDLNADKVADEPYYTPRGPPDEVHPINGTLRNWGDSYVFRPAVILEPTTYDEIIEAIRDHNKYPSPVRALGR